MKPLYLHQISSVSPFTLEAATEGSSVVMTTNRYSCIEPDYKEWIDNPTLRRRMSRIVRMGVASAMQCLADRPQDGGGTAVVDAPEAIITATALGCLADTEKFLASILENPPSLINPTPFIQSTFNTIGGQIALMTGNHGANITFVHRGNSLSAALLESMMMIHGGEARKVLTGCVEELTDYSFEVMSRLGFWKSSRDLGRPLFPAVSKGSVAGEGAHFFVLSGAPSPWDYAMLRDIRCVFHPQESTVADTLSALLQEHGLAPSDVSLMITGENGDVRTDWRYRQLSADLMSGVPSVPFKHLCGEYATSTGFALWMACRIFAGDRKPFGVFAGPIKHILIYNHYLDRDHSFLLLSDTGQELLSLKTDHELMP